MKKIKFIFIFCTLLFVPFLWKGTNIYAQTWKPITPLLYSTSEPSSLTVLSLYSNKLLLFGNIVKLDNVFVNGITRPITWNGSTFDSIPNLCNFHGMVYCFAEFNNKLYCGGEFNSVSNTCGIGNIQNTEYVARFNGISVESLNNNTPVAKVNALKVKGNNLYIAGDFYFIGSTIYGCIAGYDGTNYFHLGQGVQGTNPGVKEMEIYNDKIIICGDFSWVGGIYTNGIAAWNGTSWETVGSPINGDIDCLTVDTINNFLYTGTYQANFSDGTPISGVLRWNGHYWEDAGLPLIGNGHTCPFKFCMYHKELYAAIYAWMDYTTSPWTWHMDTLLMRYNGNNWHNIPGGFDNDLSALCVYNDDLYIGGGFTTAGNDSAYGIACLHVEEPTGCNWLMPRAFSNADTIYLNGGHAQAQFYNNNAYAQNWLWIFGDGTTDNQKDPLHDYTQTGTYTATVIVTQDGCVKTADKTIAVLMGNNTEDYTRESLCFKLYPNPSTGEITIEVNIPDNKKAEIKLYSNYGSLQETLTLNPGKNTLSTDTKKYSGGIGLCSLYIEGKPVITEKVVIQK